MPPRHQRRRLHREARATKHRRGNEGTHVGLNLSRLLIVFVSGPMCAKKVELEGNFDDAVCDGRDKKS